LTNKLISAIENPLEDKVEEEEEKEKIYGEEEGLRRTTTTLHFKYALKTPEDHGTS